MLPTSLPELPKPSRTPEKSQQPEFLSLICLQKKYIYSLLSPFGALLGGTFSFTARISSNPEVISAMQTEAQLQHVRLPIDVDPRSLQVYPPP